MNLLLSLVGFALLTPIQTDTRQIVGYIDKINGNSVFLKAAGAKTPVPLKKTNEKWLLREADVVSCGQQSSAIVFVSGKKVSLTAGKSVQASKADSTTAKKNEWLASINEVFHVGGRSRGTNDRIAIWSPVSDTCVISSTFRPGYDLADESEVAVFRTDDTPIWTFKDNGKPLPDDEIAKLRQKLKQLQQDSSRVSLTLSVQYSASQAQSAFSLLSAKEEGQIVKQLTECDKIEDPFQRGCARAAIFARAAMVNDQVGELEKLSALFTDSQDLKEQMLDAEKAIGKSPSASEP
jgi:hypothetical protein